MKKVIIVDDDRDFLDELADFMEASNYEIITLSDPKQVMNQALEEKPDTIILDLKMEGMDGFQLACELKRSPSTRSIRLVALTGYYMNAEDKLRMMNCGFEDCVTKPVELLDLLSAIEA